MASFVSDVVLHCVWWPRVWPRHCWSRCNWECLDSAAPSSPFFPHHWRCFCTSCRWWQMTWRSWAWYRIGPI